MKPAETEDEMIRITLKGTGKANVITYNSNI